MGARVAVQHANELNIYVNSPLVPLPVSFFILPPLFVFGAILQTSIRGLSRTMVYALGALNHVHAVDAAI